MSPTHARIVDQVRSFLIARHPGDDLVLGDATGLLGAGIGLDSVEALQLVSRMEEVFGVTIADEDLDAAHFRTVGTFARFIEARLL
jgi:acyl carrier protein